MMQNGPLREPYVVRFGGRSTSCLLRNLEKVTHTLKKIQPLLEVKIFKINKNCINMDPSSDYFL